MNYIHRNCRSLASLTRRVGILLARPAVTAITQPDEPPHWTARPLLPVPARTITTSEPRAGVQASRRCR